ncbi:putative universal stress protein SH1215 isoform X1 [Haliotis cracherodii]|uniref:putative universal stress protein SH1215 isoform X1 n=1 Tax=Haliotis cracherodii TaxID=6455 RepID=UPI0039E9A16F
MAGDKRHDMSSFHHIVLLAADNTEFSEYAFNWYKDYIHRPENFVIILHCTDHQAEDFRDASSKDASGKKGPGRTAKMFKEYTEALRCIEEKFGTLMANAGMHGKIRKGNGKPGEAIIQAAAEEGASMIVTGTRGLSKLKRTFLGSVSDYVAHHSPVPVIICRRSERST